MPEKLPPITGLPLPPGEKSEGSSPTGLPEAKVTTDSKDEAQLSSNIEKARICSKCKRPGRVVSNYLGVYVHCGPCKIYWPVTNSPLRGETPGTMPRGISKTTYVEPDWNIAFEKDVGD